jgi:glycosyltransferase involved in cell wall biosynthesis
MMNPKVTVLLCTVRPNQAYVQHPEWHVLGKVIDDLNEQTWKDFELVIVDGVIEREDFYGKIAKANFPVKRLPPRDNLWTRNKLAAISTFRNTGLSVARGELIINLDDCCELPPNFVEVYSRGWFDRGIAISATWPETGDARMPPEVVQDGRLFISKVPAQGGRVYGFASYPLKLALELNGYDEAYDGSMYLEDTDWSIRLHQAGLETRLAYIPGFLIHDQSGHDPRALAKPALVKCCNQAWQMQRVLRNVIVANKPGLWNKETLRQIIGPCFLLRDEMCAHHGFNNKCAYLEEFAVKGHPIAEQIYDEPPVVDLVEERKRNGREG